MEREPLTLDEIRASNPEIDHAKIAATIEEDIRRHQIEDGEDPDAALPPFRPIPKVRAIRTRLRMTQEAVARSVGNMAEQPGLAYRHRDNNGAISKKHGNTLVSTLRETYGPSFAKGVEGKVTLREVLHELDEASLTKLVHDTR